MSTFVAQALKDPVYLGERTGIYATLKQVIMRANPALASMIGFPPMMVGAALVAGVSAGLAQMDYLHKREGLRRDYQEELASLLKKPVNQVKAEDLDAIAGQNRTIDEELKQAKRQRMFGVVMSFVASAVAIAAVFALMPALTTTLGLSAIASPVLHTMAELALDAAIGVTTYHLVKDPIYLITDKIFDLDHKTTHDRITEIKDDRAAGKHISREQIIAVFASANPELDRFIRSEQGNSFDKLDLAAKQRVTETISKLMPLNQLTADINSGKVNVTELAFAVDGQISGVRHNSAALPQKTGVLTNVVNKLRQAVGLASAPVQASMRVTSNIMSNLAATTTVDYQEQPTGHFVERLGRPRYGNELGHVERLEQSRNAPSTPTLP